MIILLLLYYTCVHYYYYFYIFVCIIMIMFNTGLHVVSDDLRPRLRVLPVEVREVAHL